MAGMGLVVMGLTGRVRRLSFIPRAVTIGFTNGIAVLIASTQIKDFFGLRTPPMPSEFLPRMRAAGTLRCRITGSAGAGSARWRDPARGRS